MSRLYRGMHHADRCARKRRPGGRRACCAPSSSRVSARPLRSPARTARRARRRAERRGAWGVGMTSIAVLAHSAKTLRRRAAAAAAHARRLRVRRPALGRGHEGQEDPEASASTPRRGRGPDLRVGRRRHGAALHSMRWPAAASMSRSCPRARPTSSRPTSVSPRTSTKRSASGCTAPAARSISARPTASTSV